MDIETLISYAKYGGLVLGGIFLTIYLFKHRRNANLGQGVSTILFGNGIAAGIAVVLLWFTDICQFDQIEQIYVILGGVAVSWVSYTSFDRTLQKNGE